MITDDFTEAAHKMGPRSVAQPCSALCCLFEESEPRLGFRSRLLACVDGSGDTE